MAEYTLTVLYVDDDPMLLRTVAGQLHAHGFAVLTTTDLQEGISLIVSADVALIDWRPMGPAMRRACESAHIPYVVYTGNPSQVASETLFVIAKPATSGDIAYALRYAYSSRRKSQCKHERTSPGSVTSGTVTCDDCGAVMREVQQV